MPESIGPYRILDILGYGGMGVVYLAEQSEPVARKLAIKLIHRNLRDPVSAARFEVERQAMARFSHVAIARIYDAGTTADGFPYFAMEYVADSVPITEYCDSHRLTLEERLELFVSVGHGVQHAHQRGILHRDLKPSNILVAEQQGAAIPKIIDFGLAKALDQPLIGDDRLTVGYMVGTPEYISPESYDEGRGRADPDTRADVYALGIILYEILCGHRPFETSGMPWLAVAQHVLTKKPPPPSRRLSTTTSISRAQVAERRQIPAPALRRRLAGELDFVVMKAIAQDREERYSSVADLTADLERHLRQEPVSAHPPSKSYRLRKFVGRHRAAVIASILVLLAMVAGTIGTSIGMVRAHREAEAAKLARAEAEELTQFLEELFHSSEPGNPAREMTARQILDTGAARIDRGFGEQPKVKARILLTIGDIYRHLALYDQADAFLSESAFLRANELGKTHPDYARSLRSLGISKHLLDRLDESEELLTEALGVFEAHGLKAEAAGALDALARAVKKRGDYARAERLLQKSVELHSEVYGSDHPKVAQSLGALGSIRIDLDRVAEGEALIRRAVKISEAHFGKEDPRITKELRNLADANRHQGRWDVSLAILQRVLGIEEKHYGKVHPKTAQALAEIALHYEVSRDMERAEANYLRAAAIYEEVYGGDSLGLAVTLNNLGTLYWSLERYEDAEPIYARALEIKEKALEPGHESIAHSVNNLGLIYWKQGRFEEAEDHLGRALEAWQESFGPDHSLVAWPLWGLAGTFRDQQRYEEAEPLYRRALEIRERVLVASDTDLHQTRSDYAALLRATGREAEADALEARNQQVEE